MLRRRVGDQAFVAALDAFLRDHPEQAATTDELQAAFESASGQDLDAFFRYWVHGGFIPRLELEYRLTDTGEGTTLAGRVTSDVPFGTLDVPVRLELDATTVRELTVTVVDGYGALPTVQLPAGARPALELDPEGLVLARRRRVVER